MEHSKKRQEDGFALRDFVYCDKTLKNLLLLDVTIFWTNVEQEPRRDITSVGLNKLNFCLNNKSEQT